MSNRELLELAAKAAGMVGYTYSRTDQGGHECMAFDEGGSHSDYWNPLTDDGDAMRLLALIQIDIDFGAYGCVMAGHRAISGGYWDALVEDEDHGGVSTLVATRRAIVMAAAEIGLKISLGQIRQKTVSN